MKKSLLLTLALSMMLTACSTGSTDTGGTDHGTGSADSNAPEYKDTITWAQMGDVTSLDPHIGKETVAVTVTTNIYSTLMRVTGESGPQPHIAESYEQLSETEWEFTIRDDVKFHDGSMLTTEDVKYSLERAINSSFVSYVVNFIEKVEITSENKILITTLEPYAPILNNLAIPFTGIVSKNYVEANGDEYLANNPMGTGPYKFVERKAGDQIKLESFDEYFLGEAPTQYLTMKVIPEAAQRVIAMETGEIDIAYTITPNNVSKIEDDPNLEALTKPALSCMSLFFNFSEGPTQDINLRKAISHAVDRQAIIDSILYGYGTVPNSMISPSVTGYVEDAPTYEYDVEKAKEYLAMSEYPNGTTLELYVNDSQDRVEVSQVVQQMLKTNLNIDVEINSFEQGTYLQSLNDGLHDLGYSAWITSTGDADYTYFPVYHSSSPSRAGNRMFYANPEADRLIELGRSTSDLETRKDYYSELLDIMYEDCTQLYLVHPTDVVAINKNVEGFVMNSDGYHQFDTVKIRS